MKWIVSVILFLGLTVQSVYGHAAKIAIHSVKKNSHAKKSLEQLKRDLATTKIPVKKFYIQTDIVSLYASQPLSKPDLNEAKGYAQSLLKMAEKYQTDWDYSNAIHHAYLVLGRVELMSGDMLAAKHDLLLAGKVSGSAQLDSFGPNMTLARELLEKGERDAVLQYLDESKKFWHMRWSRRQLNKWAASIRKGAIPDFGANLGY